MQEGECEAMFTQNGNITPGGRLDILENPHSSEAGPMDSGGDQPLLNIFSERSSKTERTPTKCTPQTSTTLAPVASDMNTPLVIEKPSNQDIDNYWQREYQEEKAARKQLEQTLCTMQLHILNLEKQISSLSTGKSPVKKVDDPLVESRYETDEEELERETDWITKAAKRQRERKKRKAESSPEVNSNSPLARQERDIAGQAKKDSTKLQAPPPIMVSGVATFEELKKVTQPLAQKELTYTSYNNNVWKVNVDDSDTYRSITQELTNKGIQWHSYENKATRPIKVMVRGLHPTCEESEIVDDLKRKGYQILIANNVIKKERKEDEHGNKTTHKRGLPLFMLTFHNGESVEKIFTIRSIMGIIVKVEPLRKTTNIIPQCKRCQAYGHTHRYCHRAAACVKCAGGHPTTSCNLRSDHKPKCVNCRGDHTANYRDV